MVTKRQAVVEERSVDAKRPLRVICVGAGISGILTSIRFPQRIPNLDLQIYEKNPDVGGTWFENKYPGCACDIPAHTYQLTFEPNLDWPKFYASSKDIHKYWKKVVAKYGCMKYIKLQHQIVQARWVAEESKWHVQVKNLVSGRIFQDTCDIFISAAGALNDWKWPKIPGLHSFKGKLLHSANWDESYDYSNKRVAVVGAGSSGIQIVPGVQPTVKHLDHYVRGKTWIATTFARAKVEERGQGLDNFHFTPEDIQTFKNSPETYQQFRKEIELELQSAHGATLRGSVEQKDALADFTLKMRTRLAKKPELVDQLMPSFPPLCRRLTPGPGYLEALVEPNVDVISTEIREIVEDGIITEDGIHRPVEAIMCATGFDTSFTPRYPIYGINNLALSEKWKATPSTYISITVDQFPNFFVYLGPNSGLGAGNLLVLLEKMADYFTECVSKIQRDNIAAMCVKPQSVEQFVGHCDKYFERTVFTEKCRSWYKNGTVNGRVSALWPGSSLHAMEVFSHPRWEDFDYTYVNSNPFGWFGNGWTENEVNKEVNVDYLNDENIDFPLAETVALNGNGHFVKSKWEEPVVANGNGHVIKQREEVAV
jgi:cation diffusion facilitator CzcD-associated flavoprotein CzcO